MSSAVCLRCDWEGPFEDRCPRCGAPLYRTRGTPEIAAEPAERAEPEPRAPDTAGPVPAGDDAPSSPPASGTSREPMTPTIDGDEPPPSGRRQRPPLPGPARWVAAAAAVALIAAVLWAQRGSGPPMSPAMAKALQGTLIYATNGGDGVTGRLWRVNVADGVATRGPRTLLPDEIVPSGPHGTWVGVRSGGSAFVYRSLSPDATPERLADGQMVAWTPGGGAVFVVTRDAAARGRCPILRLTFVGFLSHGRSDLYEEPTCSTVDGLAVDGLTRPFVSMNGPRDRGVFELGYKQLHQVVPEYSLLGVSPVGDMLVGPRVDATTGPSSAPWPILRTLLVWQGVGGPIIIGNAHDDLRAERFLAWSEDGHEAAILGTLGDVRGVWQITVEPGEGRERPEAVSPELSPSVGAVGAVFAGNTLLVAAEGRLYASGGRGYREVDLPDGAPPPSGPMLWLER